MNDILNFSSGSGGTVLFLVVLGEQAGLPIPAAPCLLTAGTLCAVGQSHPAMVISVTVLACLIADLAWFYIGRRAGKQVLTLLARLGLSAGNQAQVEQKFIRHSGRALVLAKFVPGVSVAVPPLAGALGLSLERFLAFDILGSVLYAGFYVALGLLFHEQMQIVLAVLDELGLCATLVSGALISAWIGFRHFPFRKTACRTT